MHSSERPNPEDPAERLAALNAQLRAVAAAQGAMGWAMRGDLVRARATLARVPAERLAEVAAAAALVSSLAEELLGPQ